MSDREEFDQTDLMSELISLLFTAKLLFFSSVTTHLFFYMTLPLLFTTVLIYVCLMCMLVHAFPRVGIGGDVLWPAHDFIPNAFNILTNIYEGHLESS